MGIENKSTTARDFILMPKKILEDKTLTNAAVGVYGAILSFMPGVVTVDALMKCSHPDYPNEVKTALKELCDHNYITEESGIIHLRYI